MKEQKNVPVMESTLGMQQIYDEEDLYGYIRVSTPKQPIDRQLIKMRELRVPEANTFIDKATGANFDRSAYKALRKELKKGSLLYIDSIDRLGRNWTETIAEWNYIVHEIEADICSLTATESFFDSRQFKAMGEYGQLIEANILATLSFVADVERKKRKDYQAEGIRAARLKGIHMGRYPLPQERINKIRMMAGERLYDVEAVSEIMNIPIQIVAEIKTSLLHATSNYQKIMYFWAQHHISEEQVMTVLQLLDMPRFTKKEIARENGVSITTVRNYTK